MFGPAEHVKAESASKLDETAFGIKFELFEISVLSELMGSFCGLREG